MTPKPPDHIALRYTGGISPLTLIFTRTGRKMEVKTGEYLSLLPSEAEGLTGRPDFDPGPDPEPEPPTTDTDPDEETPS